jgi:predicted metalloprotease with PDZ domain
MWRGGLSGPGSFFVHADRPLITPDVTSPILHEVLHSTLRVRAATGDDWIVEGLAEYYALDLLVRSKTIGRSRHDRALADLARKGRRASSLTTDSASGPVTDRAVGFLRQLDAEIREASKGARSLDDVVRAIQSESSGEVSRALLRTESERAAGRSLGGLFERNGL